jgi:hypothetical protein
MRGTVEYIIWVERTIRVDYTIHAPVVPRYHRYVLPLEDLFIESDRDYEEGVISQVLGRDNVEVQPRKGRGRPVFAIYSVMKES